MIERVCFMSPAGLIEITGGEKGIQTLYFRDDGMPGQTNHTILKECMLQVDQYFSGSRQVFELALDPRGTDFQKRVWKELLRIPYGEVITYSALAERLGGRQYTRIVGQANGLNPISIIIPCHRVIGKNGALTGYGGGLWRKKLLLELEQNTPTMF